MARVRRDVQFGFGPGAMQVPRASYPTDHIIATLDDHSRDVPDLPDIVHQIVVTRKETVVHEVVALNTSEREREMRVSELFNRLGIEEEFGRTAFPNTPGTRRGNLFLLIITREPAIVGTHHIATFVFRNNFFKLFPHVGEYPTRAFLVKPFNLFRPAKKDAAQYEFSRAIRMAFSISERQRASPGPSENLPLIDAEMFAQLLDVCDQIPRRVFLQRGVRSALA